MTACRAGAPGLMWDRQHAAQCARMQSLRISALASTPWSCSDRGAQKATARGGAAPDTGKKASCAAANAPTAFIMRSEGAWATRTNPVDVFGVYQTAHVHARPAHSWNTFPESLDPHDPSDKAGPVHSPYLGRLLVLGILKMREIQDYQFARNKVT